MSIERWTDERLDQLAQLVESNSRTIQALANLAAEDRQERVEILQEIRDIKQEIREIQQEVRGLQTENQRMLDILLNDRRQDNQDSQP
ncbi:hypothetical protein [Trichothermofontia sp.]